MTDITGFETKAGGSEPTLGDLYSAFEEFKRTNDERLGELEKRGSTDAVTDDKLERLNRALDGYKSALDRAALDRARPVLDGGAPVGGDEYKQAFSAYVKRGEEKSLSVGTNADGGYVVPTEVETEITRRLTVLSPIRSIAGVRQVSASLYKKPVTVGGPAVGWVGEKDARPQTDSQTIDAISFPTMELYAMPAATANFLDDAAVDVGQWIADEVNAAFAAWRADATLAVPVFDAPPKGQAGSYVAIVRHDIRARDGDLAPGYEHRLLLHVWHDQPSRAAALEIAEKLVATALAAESAALAVTFRQHAGTDTVIDTKTGRARAAVTLRFFTEPTT